MADIHLRETRNLPTSRSIIQSTQDISKGTSHSSRVGFAHAARTYRVSRGPHNGARFSSRELLKNIRSITRADSRPATVYAALFAAYR
ncbi:hypothetical protein EVAR_23674_1 [Eumeta japonica]|uniref:Uncharacterized protein n=1 Tax=Eumeta variegata TaxID=151549 RepID=A0A4C1VH76_EUMVA|nr:hypothetical protein EVAR_23674_1 [Eumeta japonica]